MAKKMERERTAFDFKLTESKAFIENDRKVIQDELTNRQKRFEMMKSFRDENKKVGGFSNSLDLMSEL